MNPCCENLDNRETQLSERPELAITRCRECGARHYELTLEPGRYDVTLP